MKKLFLFLPLLLITIISTAQFGSENQTIVFSTGATDVKSFDLDGDGDFDILTASANDNKIAWYENLGNSTFESQQIISSNANGASSVYFSDLDGDGDFDVLSASTNDDKIAWYENLGNGSFGSQQIISINADGASSVYSSDLDGDGDFDILSASTNDDKIAWYENLGNGSFGSQQIISINADGARDVYAIDLNNDGDIDILSASYNDDKIAWYENLGNGNFGAQQIISSSLNEARSVYSADLDGDGDVDVLSASSSVINASIAWYENLGNGSFGPKQIIKQGTSIRYSSVDATDLDGDGDLDVLSASEGDNRIAWYENLGNGNFGSSLIIANNVYIASAVYASDIDGDGDSDVLSASVGNGEIAWYENLGDSIFSAQNPVSTASAFGPLSTHAADLDNDGDIDVLSASRNDYHINWFENLGYNHYSPKKVIDSFSLFSSVYAADLDNDGFLDALSTSFSEKKVVWYKNLGNGTFGSEQILSNNADGARDVYAIDLNNDGDIDVLSASSSDDKIAWYENLGNGSFSSEKILTTFADGACTVYAADLDQDGDNDILSASTNDEKVSWYENYGGGNFGPPLSSFLTGVLTIYAADINNDVHLDLIFGTSGGIYYSLNPGNANFNIPQPLTTSVSYANDIFSTDLDSDGDNDIITSQYIADNIVWLENLGGTTFSPEQIITSSYTAAGSSETSSIMGIDMDGDGDKDILSVASNSSIIWNENYFNSPYQFQGNVFYDSNQNTIIDSNEFGLPFIQMELNPNSLAAYSDNNGNYFFATDTGTYTVNYIPNSLWGLTTDSSSYTKTLTGANPIADSLDFGFYPNTITTIIEPELTGGFPRCNTIINYWVNIRNEGTTLPDGIVHIQLDDSVSYVSSINPPDSIVGQNIYWHFDSLFFFSEEMINLQVQMPPFTSMGDTLISILNVYELDGSNNIVYTNTDTLNQILVCSFDPNDKTVLPKGIGSQGFIANNQPLEYLIRFQNTGNDTALTVMVRDQLDDNLDWASLKPLASSHSMQVWIEQDGEAVFKFNNIMLPDSNVDFLGSQGFVKFSINQNPNLAPNTPIFNTGHIYFDYNTAVITNTVLNTIEDTTSFPVSVQEITFTETNEIIVFPNPFTEHITVYYKAKINAAYHVSLFDMSGKELLKKENNTSNKTELDVSQLKNGIYIIVGTDTNGKKLFSERIVAQ
ncbi:MAG: T9SS type A sorting domain-containing protein [Bacteroidetes bacterium]|nr:T9SS type A sorting domain-containing protein [Bacteroidota bacterium]